MNDHPVIQSTDTNRRNLLMNIRLRIKTKTLLSNSSISIYFCNVVCHSPSLSVNGNVCIVRLVLAWTS